MYTKYVERAAKDVKKKFIVNFIGVGAPKCGTEWLVKCLREHPEIDFSKHKEINYFLSPTEGITNFVHENIRIKTLDKYKKEFTWKKNTIKGEFNNHYLFDKNAVKKIKQTFPNVKILITLRNPVDYLFSIFWYMKYSNAYHKIPDTFEDAVKSANVDDLYDIGHAKFSQYVKMYITTFGKKSVHVILLDDIKKNPAQVIKKVFEFLEIDSNFVPTVTHKHINKTREVRSIAAMKYIGILVSIASKFGFGPLINNLMNTDNVIKTLYQKVVHSEKKYIQMKKSTRSKLKKTLFEDICELEKLIDRDLKAWKN